VLSLEFAPETEYEKGITLPEDYQAIINEYRASSGTSAEGRQ